MTKKKRKFKISGTLILNIIVGLLTVYLIFYFCTSENGLLDLLASPDSFNLIWLIIAVIVYDLNIFIDGVVTLIFIRARFKTFRFFDALKVAFVGIFFGAVTPSSTGGQPMQLYVLSKMKVDVGFGSACMTQKFIVYQIMTAAFSIFSVIFDFKFFEQAFTGFWSSAFIILGLASQMLVTALLVIVSFSRGITKKLIQLASLIMHKLKFIKNPDGKVERLEKEVDMFHRGNKLLLGNKKLLLVTYILVFFQVLTIMSAPYFIYLSFGMPEIAAANNQPVGTFFDFVCIQSFVIFTSNLVPLPGASGGAELAFTMYFAPFFVFGSIDKIKPAVLLWRFVAYYGTLIISAPFSYLTKGKKSEDKKEAEEVKDIAEVTTA